MAKTEQKEIFPAGSAFGNQKWSAIDPESHWNGECTRMSLRNALTCINNEAFLFK